MKPKCPSRSGVFGPRILVWIVLCAAGVFLALIAFGVYPGGSVRAQAPQPNQDPGRKPGVVQMVGPYSLDQDLRTLPYIPPNEEKEEVRLMRHPQTYSQGIPDPLQAVRRILGPTAMPTPIATFDGMNSVQSACSCLPPDPNGDVGPSHYVQSVNLSIKIFDKRGTALNGANGTTYNSLFSAMGRQHLAATSKTRAMASSSTIIWQTAGW